MFKNGKNPIETWTFPDYPDCLSVHRIAKKAVEAHREWGNKDALTVKPVYIYTEAEHKAAQEAQKK